MKLLTPLRPEPTAVLAHADPVAKLAAAALLLLILFFSTDAITALVVLGGLAVATRFSGLRPPVLLARTWPILLAALSVGILNVVFAAPEGRELLRVGPLVVGSDNVVSGIGLGLRLLAIAFSGVLAMVTTDATELADSLVQHLRFSPRFAIGALAAARLLPIMAGEWQTLSLARRARGVTAGRSPVAAIRLFFGKLLALLVSAVRRATRLATAMESRGFGSLPCRTIARPRRFKRGDGVLVGAALTLGLAAIGISVALGSWSFLFS
jgi:energy-coupling factor transport system permease protein